MIEKILFFFPFTGAFAAFAFLHEPAREIFT
jgi:hypothetical protein